MIIGILGINKPSGMTSFDVIRILKKKTGIKKIGHGGTLDPMAEGVLPVLIDKGTVFFDALLHSGKQYQAKIQLGQATDTDDKEGAVIETSPVPDISLDQIHDAVQALTGEIRQIPPQYSALKIDGKRAYDLARDGKTVELQARKVVVYEWKNISYDPDKKIISADIFCGSGTYIRSLARDLSRMLGTVGHLAFLRRTLSGGIDLEHTLALDSFPENWKDKLITPEKALLFLPDIKWLGDMKYLCNGKPLLHDLCDPYPEKEGLYRLMVNDKIMALVFFDGKKLSYRTNLVPLYKNNQEIL